ncbi:carboxylic ester hydrolase [Plakobranchus ocellatus]|uniref:Carboxylic ester hydrolase n=1 Tax=Plakobranchus ocellatus TaxID=259542 RepID=A0AAV4DD32_9GAST|nr:carboxylic ester hydrolase [Plakobranchus ocellatus]
MKIFLLFLVHVSVLCLLVHAAPELQLQTGIARGSDKQAVGTLKPYFAYYGIPFAEPPVGNLRFSPPRRYVGRGAGTVLTSDTYRASCYQVPPPSTETMSEDCLHLNVFSPADVNQGRLKKVTFTIGFD